MLQSISSVFVVYRRKTLTGSPDPTHANGTDKPCSAMKGEGGFSEGSTVKEHPPGQQAGGKHPTGILSCYELICSL